MRLLQSTIHLAMKEKHLLAYRVDLAVANLKKVQQSSTKLTGPVIGLN